MDYHPKFFKLQHDNTWSGDAVNPPYLFNKDIAIAVDVALATRRPLLISGPPGCGKSMLAPAMAGLLGSRLLKHTFTSRSRLGEMTCELDHLRRLHEAQAKAHGETLPPEWAYLEPGLFWWAFDPSSARQRGATQQQIEKIGAAFRTPDVPKNAENGGNAVILLDEIDKAEPDLPNDLLEPLDRMSFQLPDGQKIVAPSAITFLVIITTNGERELPPAFLRRCVSLTLKHPSKAKLVEIGQRHFDAIDKNRLSQIAERFQTLRQQARQEGMRLPSTSEYLDAVRAANTLDIHIDDPFWQQVETASLVKKTDWIDDFEEE